MDEGESRPLIFRGRTIGHMQIGASGVVSGQIDPSMLTEIETMDLYWHAWTDRYILDTQADPE